GLLSGRTAGFAAGPPVFLATRPARGGTSVHAKIGGRQPKGLPKALSHTLLSHQLRRANVDDFCNRWFGVLGIGVPGLSESKPSLGQDDFRINPSSRGFSLDTSGRCPRR